MSVGKRHSAKRVATGADFCADGGEATPEGVVCANEGGEIQWKGEGVRGGWMKDGGPEAGRVEGTELFTSRASSDRTAHVPVIFLFLCGACLPQTAPVGGWTTAEYAMGLVGASITFLGWAGN